MINNIRILCFLFLLKFLYHHVTIILNYLGLNNIHDLYKELLKMIIEKTAHYIKKQFFILRLPDFREEHEISTS